MARLLRQLSRLHPVSNRDTDGKAVHFRQPKNRQSASRIELLLTVSRSCLIFDQTREVQVVSMVTAK